MKKAGADITLNGRLEYHLTSEVMMDVIFRTMAHPSERVDMSLFTAMQVFVQKIQTVLTSIVKCVELCGRQGIAFRGHRDNTSSTVLFRKV